MIPMAMCYRKGIQRRQERLRVFLDPQRHLVILCPQHAHQLQSLGMSRSIGGFDLHLC